MIRVLGNPAAVCEGVTRREWLRLGGLGAGAGGLTLSRLLAAQAVPSVGKVGSFGRAKSCIVLFMFGAPAHQDTFDMKPDAPSEVRGEFRPIATNVPGIQVCEHLPRVSRLANRFAQVRSVTHPDDTHTVAMHYMLTGVRHRRPKTNPENAPDDFPCFGAVANRVMTDGETGLPPSVSLNAPANQVSANNHIFPGFFAGFLGNRFDPAFVSQSADQPAFQPLPTLSTPIALLERKELLRHVELGRARWENDRVRDFTIDQERAFQLLTSAPARRAFDIGQEPDARRERYGMTPFGQGCLLARRLVEAGVSLVTVNWERDDAYWDTHADNFNKHKDPLLPNLDRGMSALIEDLEQRGLLDETLVVWLSEFGRTPKINQAAGRDHWAACNTVLFAGAGVPGGSVVGKSDRIAAYPESNPVAPEDLAATIYHLLGIELSTLLHDQEGRPLQLCHGRPIEMLV